MNSTCQDGHRFTLKRVASKYGQEVDLDICLDCYACFFDRGEIQRVVPNQLLPMLATAGPIQNSKKTVEKSGRGNPGALDIHGLGLCPRCHNELIFWKEPTWPAEIDISRCPKGCGFLLGRSGLSVYLRWRQQAIARAKQELTQGADKSRRQPKYSFGSVAQNKNFIYGSDGSVGALKGVTQSVVWQLVPPGVGLLWRLLSALGPGIGRLFDRLVLEQGANVKPRQHPHVVRPKKADQE